ncbi:MAG: hypothetical protein IMW89_21850, partial [Ktedonobacteraceae bacterium]|nr:hypothetical protein [Ktedonobacteraceae bacterium]
MKQKRKLKKPSLTITPQQGAFFSSASRDSDTQPTEPCQVPTLTQAAGETPHAAPADISQHNTEQSQKSPAAPAGKNPELRRLALPATNTGAQTEIATQDTVESPALPTAKADIARLATEKSPILVDEKEDISRLDTAKSAALPEEDGREQTQPGSPPVAPPAIPPIGFTTSPAGMAEKKPQWLTRWLHIVLLISMVLPALLIIVEGLNAAMLYTYAHEGVQHLFNVKNVFTGAQAHPSGLLDANKLRLAQTEFTAAQNNFKLLDEKLRNDPVIGIAGGILPQQVTSARALSRIGVDITEMG